MIVLALMIALATGLALYFAAPLIKAKDRTSAMAVGFLAPAAAFAIYLMVGAPEAVVGGAGQAAQEERRAVQMIAELEAVVAEEPDNLAAWDSLAGLRYSRGDFAGAVGALERLVVLEPASAELRASLGEMRVIARGGVVDEEAVADFESALAMDPDEPRAVFYLAEAEFQAGRSGAAISRWAAQAEAAPPDAPWLAALASRLQRAALAQQISLDGLGLSNETVEKLELAMSGQAPSRSGGPDAEAMAAMAALSPEEQAAQIEAMVEGLAARLEQEPDDLEGWVRLARSYQTLGRTEEFQAALGQIARLSPDDVEAQRNYAYVLLNRDAEAGAELDPLTVEALERLLALDESDPMALLTMGVVTHARGESDESRTLLVRLAESEDAPAALRDQARALIVSYGFEGAP